MNLQNPDETFFVFVYSAEGGGSMISPSQSYSVPVRGHYAVYVILSFGGFVGSV